MKLKKTLIKKRKKYGVNQINLLNPNSQSNTILNNDIEEKSIKKERKNESIRLTRQIRDSSHET